MAVALWYVCAAINVAIAIFHIVVIVIGESAYRAFGAGEWMASQDAAGSWIPAIITAGITVVFFVFAAFNLAGAGRISLPLTIPALTAITGVYLLRGGVLVAMPFMSQPVSTFDIVSSLMALAIGLLHAVGLYTNYQSVDA